MDEFKEFQGKDLDSCIKEAGAYFNSPREKLEVEIIQDAKSGIFGIVGARKAKIRARRAQIDEKMLDFLETHPQRQDGGKGSYQARSARNRNQENRKTATGKFSRTQGKSNPPQEAHPQKKEILPASDSTSDAGEIPTTELSHDSGFPDKERLASLTCETVKKLLQPIAGKEVDVIAEICHGLVKVNVGWEGDAGLLIGREGQTLASLQYIASRILSQTLNTGIRIQLEIGDYKSRQDEKIRERAHALAEKARQTGRSWATPPLSSYHRRIVHMELQDEPGIITRSTGEGMMKKVIIAPKRMADSA